MKQKDFEDVFCNTIEACRETLIHRAKLYAENGDRLSNFKDAASLAMHGSAEGAVWGFVLKHIVALKTKINNPDAFTYDQWEESCKDIINYMILLLAIRKEKQGDANGIQDNT